MDRWLDGDLTGFDPRSDGARLRDAVANGLARGVDPTPVVTALSVLHPVALADLALSPDAPSDAAWAAALVPVLPALEAVVSPGGLYARVCDAAGPHAAPLLAVAMQRHLTAAWLPALARRHDGLDVQLDAVPAMRGTVARMQCGAGFPQAVARRIASGDVELLAAVAPSDLEAVVALATDLAPDGPAIAAWGALIGPAAFGRAEALATRCRTDAGRAAARFLLGG